MLVYQTKDGHKHQKEATCQNNSLKDSIVREQSPIRR